MFDLCNDAVPVAIFQQFLQDEALTNEAAGHLFEVSSALVSVWKNRGISSKATAHNTLFWLYKEEGVILPDEPCSAYRLRQLKRELEYTWKELADGLGCSENALIGWASKGEVNRPNGYARLVNFICDTFAIAVDEEAA